jgi:hypothetical protein
MTTTDERLAQAQARFLKLCEVFEVGPDTAALLTVKGAAHAAQEPEYWALDVLFLVASDLESAAAPRTQTYPDAERDYHSRRMFLARRAGERLQQVDALLAEL